jgi:3'-phosphoadenosine 5'-phosphosulfate sulfotransferase (PAPS reductase)/FAD synthetase
VIFVHVVSVSSGKDSEATMLLAIGRVGKDRCRFVFCDTGNEDEKVFEHLDYLRSALGVTIDVLRSDFSAEIAAKREFIARDQRVGRRGGRRIRWTNKAKRRALAVLHPTGNPFLDLCLWKGRFPSRRAQFCTQELKTLPLVEYQMALIDAGYGVISWQGIRRDESEKRKDARLFERVGKRLWTFRPIILWTAQQVVDYCLSFGLRLNPLYSEGFDRVGCMPCINCGKDDISNTAARRPAAITRLAEWERLVGQASKRGESSFFPNPHRDDHLDKRGIYAMVEWAKTSYGGRQFKLMETASAGCASSYGLCDAP